MTGAMLLTASNTFIIGPIAKLFGMIMNWIFNLGVTNLGVCIILFTMIIYALQLPLTMKQQKFSKMSAIMNPELTAIQKKYKNRKDNDSMMRMQAETKEVYEKYGTSPTGGCLPLLIQLPVLWALYRVIYNIPAYVSSIKAIYNQFGLVDLITNNISSDSFITFAKTAKVTISTFTSNSVIDVLWKLQDSTWTSLKELGSGIANFSASADQTYAEIKKYTMFFGINIADSPMSMFMASWSDKKFLMCLVAILIPVLSGFTQWLNVKLMPQPNMDPEENPMAAQMKSMNMMMPLMSVFFCFTLPTGLGIYWIAGAVFRSIQQLAINKYLDKIDINEIVAQNQEKIKEKKQKEGVIVNKNLADKAKINTRTINNAVTEEDISDQTSDTPKAAPKPGSLAEKANMVKQYNERNRK